MGHDGSGSIDKTNSSALTLLGLEVTRGETDDLFESLDADSSGTIEFEELKRALHSSATVELDAAYGLGLLLSRWTKRISSPCASTGQERPGRMWQMT